LRRLIDRSWGCRRCGTHAFDLQHHPPLGKKALISRRIGLGKHGSTPHEQADVDP
jgi:hypothetical protein